MSSDEIRRLIRSGRIPGEQYGALVLRLYVLERGADVEFIEATYDGDRFISQRLRVASHVEREP